MNKINIYWLIRNHVSSLKIDGETSLSRMDICLHFIFPLVAAFITCYFFKVMPTPVVGIMVNFGSITTALLMSCWPVVAPRVSNWATCAISCYKAQRKARNCLACGPISCRKRRSCRSILIPAKRWHWDCSWMT